MPPGAVGFLSPPDWDDPSPAEFAALHGRPTVARRLVSPPGFDWDLDRVGAFEPQLIELARAIVTEGAEIVGIVGTPFGWAGLPAGDSPHDRNQRIAEACERPVVSAVSAIIDQLRDREARGVALAATYYDATWLPRWSALLAGLGFDVVAAASLADIGLTDGPLAAADTTHWAPTPDQIEGNVAAVVETAIGSSAEVVIVSGAGARTAAIRDQLEHVAGRPVLASDTALYDALAATGS